MSLIIGSLKVCEGCKESFEMERFFRHVSHSKKCLDAYGTEKWNEMLQERKDFVLKRKARKRSQNFWNLKESLQESMPTHEKFQSELKKLEWSTKCDFSGTISYLIETINGGIYYFRNVNEMIVKPNPKISEILKQLASDTQDFENLKQDLNQRFTELVNVIHKLPGFDTFVNGDDDQKDIQKRHDDFTTKARNEVSKFKNVVGKRFKTLENMLDMENSNWTERYKEYRFSAMGFGDRRKLYQLAEFKKCCKKASLLPESKSVKSTVDTSPKQCEKVDSKENSPKIKQKPFFHKRKKIDFNMTDLENAVEDENDSDFVQ